MNIAQLHNSVRPAIFSQAFTLLTQGERSVETTSPNENITYISTSGSVLFRRHEIRPDQDISAMVEIIEGSSRWMDLYTVAAQSLTFLAFEGGLDMLREAGNVMADLPVDKGSVFYKAGTRMALTIRPIDNPAGMIQFIGSRFTVPSGAAMKSDLSPKELEDYMAQVAIERKKYVKDYQIYLEWIDKQRGIRR